MLRLEKEVEVVKQAILRGEHLENLNEYLKGVRLKWDESKGYSLKFAQKHDEALKDIIQKKKCIKIIEGFDEICNCGVCPNKKESCLSQEVIKRCYSIASKYGVTIGREYKFEELVELFKRKEGKKRW